MSSSMWNLFGIFSKLPIRFPRTNISRRGLLFASSAAGLMALLVTAIYMRRKRKPLPAINPVDHEDKNGNIITGRHPGKKRKRSKGRRAPSAGSRRQYATRHQRDNSMMSESSAVSSVRSSISRRSLISNLPPPGTKEFYDAERLYRLGVDAFENAMSQWEKASSVLTSDVSDGSSCLSGRNSSLSHGGSRHTQTSIHSNSETNSSCGKKTPSRSRSVSMSKSRTPTDSSYLMAGDMGYPAEEEKITENETLNSSSASEIEQKLLVFMERAERLQKTFEEVLYSESETDSDTDITLTGYDDPRLSDIDSDTESFVSAQEIWETLSLDEIQQNLALYEAALEAVDRGCVRCRTIRTELLECFSDVEFLAKLHCVRQALDVMLQDTTIRDWLLESGRVIIESILKSANHDSTHFKDAFTRLIEYVTEQDNWIKIEDELKGRKVVSMTFYDIVLDFIIMDSFDDLDRPPSSVLSVLGNRWLANSIKETALSTAVWSVLKAKSRMLRYQDGFIAKFYAVSETVSPVLAWGFLGADEKLKSNCMKFKSEILLFLRGMFSFEQVRYSTVPQLSDDILNLARQRIQRMMTFFEMAQR